MKPFRAFSSRPTFLVGLATLIVGCGGGSGGGGGNSDPVVPRITRQPESVTAVQGGTATLTVAARGRGTLGYQWYRVNESGQRQSISDGANVSGSATSSLRLSNLSSSSVGLYQVLVESSNGNQTYSDAAAVLFDGSAPVITTPPQAKAASLGSAVAFTVVAAGTPTPTYQWFKDGAPIAGATQAVYRIASVTNGSVGDYAVQVTNANGSVTSTPVALTLVAAPAIVAQPVSRTVALGDPVSFTVSATGGDLSYQWFRNSVQIARATSATYTIPAATAANAGTYTVRVENSAGSVVSAGAVLTVTSLAPTITVQPSPSLQNVQPGSPVSYSVTATGAGLSYQWYRNDGSGAVAIPGANSATYAFNAPAASATPYIYYVVVTNANGQATSSTVRLAVGPQP